MRVALITNDGDFLDANGLRIHADLVDDLKNEGLSSGNVLVCDNRIQFHQKHVDQDLQLLRDIEAEMEKLQMAHLTIGDEGPVT